MVKEEKQNYVVFKYTHIQKQKVLALHNYSCLERSIKYIVFKALFLHNHLSLFLFLLIYCFYILKVKLLYFCTILFLPPSYNEMMST